MSIGRPSASAISCGRSAHTRGANGAMDRRRGIMCQNPLNVSLRHEVARLIVCRDTRSQRHIERGEYHINTFATPSRWLPPHWRVRRGVHRMHLVCTPASMCYTVAAEGEHSVTPQCGEGGRATESLATSNRGDTQHCRSPPAPWHLWH